MSHAIIPANGTNYEFAVSRCHILDTPNGHKTHPVHQAPVQNRWSAPVIRSESSATTCSKLFELDEEYYNIDSIWVLPVYRDVQTQNPRYDMQEVT